jgi:hypothetical protein
MTLSRSHFINFIQKLNLGPTHWIEYLWETATFFVEHGTVLKTSDRAVKACQLRDPYLRLL